LDFGIRSLSGVLYFIFVEPRDEVTLVQMSTVYLIGLGRRGFHPTHGEKRSLGKCFMHTLLAQGSVGLASSRRAQWPYLWRPGGRLDVLPLKPQAFAPLAMEVFFVC